jgi:glycosyltransferase involved in cell wall biosynthesis
VLGSRIYSAARIGAKLVGVMRIHIFNGFQSPFGGSALEALALFKLLDRHHEVRLWATSSRASAELLRAFPISRVAPFSVDGGNYVFVGAHWRKLWRYWTKRPDRLIYIYNTFHPKHIAIATSPPWGWPKTELVFISEFEKRLLGLDGVVHPSPIDINRFAPRPVSERHQIIVGRLSRDTAHKYNRQDVPIFLDLAQRNVRIRLQGASCLADDLRHSNIEVLSEGAEPAERFLQGLDIFYYRTGTHVETFGRVVFEAMACGLPVVCHRYGGYSDWIVSGKNGFLFSTDDEARNILDQLIADPLLRQSAGANARQTIEDMYASDKMDERLQFYVRSKRPLPHHSLWPGEDHDETKCCNLLRLRHPDNPAASAGKQ